MIRRALAPLALGASLLLPAQESPLPTRPEQLPPRGALKFAPPALVPRTLPNGLRLILLEDHTLPLVHLKAIVRAGSIYDPADRVGTAQLAGACLAAAGTAGHSADALHETLESLAADLKSEGGAEETTVTLDLLSKDLGRGLPLFAEVLVRPAFEPAKVEVERTKMAEEIKRENDEPFQAADREFRKALYGADSPWARTPSLKGLSGIAREDLAAFHARLFRPGTTILAASGDFDAASLSGKLAELFAGWASGEVGLPAVAAAPEASPSGILLLDKPDLTQATVLVGELAGKRFEGGSLNPDRYPMEVLNNILGGAGFNSALMREIRSNRGLAYNAGSFFTFGADRGFFVAYSQTGVETVPQVVGLIREILTKAVNEPPAESQLALARDGLLNRFVFKYDRPSGVVDEAALLALRGFPADYLATYCDRVRAVSEKDALAVARKIIHPEKEKIVVLGPAKALIEPLKAFGPVTVVPLPEP